MKISFFSFLSHSIGSFRVFLVWKRAGVPCATELKSFATHGLPSLAWGPSSYIDAIPAEMNRNRSDIPHVFALYCGPFCAFSKLPAEHSPCFWGEAVDRAVQDRGREVRQTWVTLPALLRWFWGTGGEASATCHSHNNWRDRVQGSFTVFLSSQLANTH